MICSSLNRLLRIVRLLGDGLRLSNEGAQGKQVNSAPDMQAMRYLDGSFELGCPLLHPSANPG